MIPCVAAGEAPAFARVRASGGTGPAASAGPSSARYAAQAPVRLASSRMRSGVVGPAALCSSRSRFSGESATQLRFRADSGSGGVCMQPPGANRLLKLRVVAGGGDRVRTIEHCRDCFGRFRVLVSQIDWRAPGPCSPASACFPPAPNEAPWPPTGAVLSPCRQIDETVHRSHLFAGMSTGG